MRNFTPSPADLASTTSSVTPVTVPERTRTVSTTSTSVSAYFPTSATFGFADGPDTPYVTDGDRTYIVPGSISPLPPRPVRTAAEWNVLVARFAAHGLVPPVCTDHVIAALNSTPVGRRIVGFVTVSGTVVPGWAGNKLPDWRPSAQDMAACVTKGDVDHLMSDLDALFQAPVSRTIVCEAVAYLAYQTAAFYERDRHVALSVTDGRRTYRDPHQVRLTVIADGLIDRAVTEHDTTGDTTGQYLADLVEDYVSDHPTTSLDDLCDAVVTALGDSVITGDFEGEFEDVTPDADDLSDEFEQVA